MLYSFFGMDTVWKHIGYIIVITMVCTGIGITPLSWWIMFALFMITFLIKDTNVVSVLTRSQNKINVRYAEHSEMKEWIDRDPKELTFDQIVLSAILKQQYSQYIHQCHGVENRIIETENASHMKEIVLALSVAGLILGLFYNSVFSPIPTPFDWMHLLIWDILDMVSPSSGDIINLVAIKNSL